MISALVMGLQGDDEIDGGASRMLIDGQGSSAASEGDEEEWEMGEPERHDFMPTFMTAGNATSSVGMDWDMLKT